MKLKTAIRLVETYYTVFTLPFAIAIIACFLFRGWTLAILVICLLAFSLIGFFTKHLLVNYCLRRCAYPYEFLSVLKQLELVQEADISWSEDLIDGPDPSRMLTQQFLADNKLATEAGFRSINWHRQDGTALSFRENGLVLDDQLYTWPGIQQWGYDGDEEDSRGKIDIVYKKGDAGITLTASLDHIRINRLDFLLLLAHFKARYGNHHTTGVYQPR
ncbi:MAG: hypothetical protein ABW019_11245 [Chitinophagaceae bacterium]